MKKIILLLALYGSLWSDVLEIKNFESDLFTKTDNQLKKIEFSLLFDGRDLKENRHKVIDALNIVISSFYIEDLFTSKGKERFKSVIKKYITKKYAVDVDDIFIQKFRVVDNVNVEAFIDALKKEGFCKEDKNRAIFDDIEIQK